VAAAKAAGMVAVAVPSRITRHNDLTQADRVVHSLEDLSLADLRALAG
jgi:beta-phosphoglucomutase-like phosphatase (HAD superfamily)